MRKTKNGRWWTAEASDTSETIFKNWGGFVPSSAILNDEAADEFMFGGMAFNDEGEGRPFDGFESVDDARTFCVEELGIPARGITVAEG